MVEVAGWLNFDKTAVDVVLPNEVASLGDPEEAGWYTTAVVVVVSVVNLVVNVVTVTALPLSYPDEQMILPVTMPHEYEEDRIEYLLGVGYRVEVALASVTGTVIMEVLRGVTFVVTVGLVVLL